jgi:hypothetical protein
MEPRTDIPILEIEAFTYWVENDILLVYTAKAVERTHESAIEFISLLEGLSKKAGRRICLLGDVTHISLLSKETREYYDEVVPRYASAVALFSESTMGNAAAFIYTTMQGDAYTVKVCDSEEQCREWLKEYLD